MKTLVKRHIKSGEEFNHLFPPAVGNNQVLQRNAQLSDTMELIPKMISATKDQTAKIAWDLRDEDLYTCCKNIWQFVYDHIDYHIDQPGAEQVRSPARAWADRFEGVDCDCYSVFISSILSNLQIPHVLRITKYSSDTFQHIYPVVITEDGGEIFIDCVTEFFDYEVPYSEKKDYPMQLQYLNGLDCVPGQQQANDSDYLDFEENDLDGNWEGRKDGLGFFASETFDIDAGDSGSSHFDPVLMPEPLQPLTEATLIRTAVPLQTWQPDPVFTPAPSPATSGISMFEPARDIEVAPVNGDIVAVTPTAAGYEAISLFPTLSTPKGTRGATCTCTLNEEAMGSIFSKIGNFIATNVKSAVNDVSNAVQDVAHFAEQNVNSAAKDISSAANSVNKFVLQNINSAGTDISRIASGVGKFTLQNLKSAGNDIATAAKDVSKFVAQNVESGIKDAGKIGQQVIDFVKKLSPLTILVRMGLRIGLKLNLFNISRRLRWGFVDPAHIGQYDISAEWHGKVTKLAQKVVHVYKEMGGDESHIRDSVMNGKGNADDPIDPGTLSGFGYTPSALSNAKYLNVNMPISKILGPGEYEKEMSEFRSLSGLSGLGDLGMEPATIAAITAAAGALAAIAKDLLMMGAQGAGNGRAARDMDPTLTNSAENTVQDPAVLQAYNDAMAKLAVTGTGTQYALPDASQESQLSDAAKAIAMSYLQNENSPLDLSNPARQTSSSTNPLYINTSNSTAAAPAAKESFFKKHKTAFIVSGVTVGVAAIGTWLYFANKKKKKEQSQPVNGFHRPLNGTKKKKTRRIRI